MKQIPNTGGSTPPHAGGGLLPAAFCAVAAASCGLVGGMYGAPVWGAAASVGCIAAMAAVMGRAHAAEARSKAAVTHELQRLRDQLATEQSERAQEVRNARESLHELKESRAAIELVAGRYRQLVGHFPDGALMYFGSDLQILVAEGGGFGSLGVAPASVLGLDPARAFDAELASSVEPAWRSALAGNIASLLVPFRDHRLKIWAQPVREQDQIIGGVCLVQDVTEYTQLEDRLRRSQRMEAIGKLAGGIAHDFNNLLFVIQGSVDQITRELTPGSSAANAASAALIAAETGSKLTRQLSALSRSQPIRPQVVDLAETTRRIADVLKRTLGSRFRIETRVPEAAAHAFADAGQVEQVLLNLCIYARDTMPDGGKLDISTAEVTLPAGSTDAPQGMYVALTIRDSGPGLDAESKARIFEPFGGGHSHGSGLGLSSVYGIMHQAGGGIGVDSKPGCGTTFTAYFPAAAGAKRSTAAAGAAKPVRAKILVVDDEPLVRDLVAATLQSVGHQAVTARDGTHALGMIENMANDFDLLLADAVMPGMGGRELASRAKEIRPNLAVLFISGYESRDFAPDALGDRERFLQKPFTTDQVREAVDRLLTGVPV